ncbi:MAG: ATP-binding protein [Lachnospirales bacterium]
MQRVVYNLLDNAIKFTNKNGKITLKIEEKMIKHTYL